MKKLLLTALFAGLVISGCSRSGGSGGDLDSLTLTKLDGTEIEAILSGKNRKKNFHFSKSKGKVVLTVYWSTSCPPCRAEVPHLVKLQEKYKDRLKIYGVLVEDRSKEDVKEFIDYFGINYDILYGENNYVLAEAMGGVRGIPAMYLFDKQGKEAKHFIGLIPPEMLETEINKLF